MTLEEYCKSKDLVERVKTETWPNLWHDFSLQRVVVERSKHIELNETVEEKLFREGMKITEEQRKLDLALRLCIKEADEWMRENCPAWDKLTPSPYKPLQGLKVGSTEITLHRDPILSRVGMHDRLKPWVSFVENTISKGDTLYIRIEDGLSFQSTSLSGLVWSMCKWKLKRIFPRTTSWLDKRKEVKNAKKKQKSFNN